MQPTPALSGGTEDINAKVKTLVSQSDEGGRAMKVRGTILCKKSVVMENGENAGAEAFTRGREYEISSVDVRNTMITIVAVNNFGTPHGSVAGMGASAGYPIFAKEL